MPHALTMSLVNVMKRWRSTKKCWLVQTSTTHTKKQREGYARRSKQSRLGSRKQNSSCHPQITQITPIYEICVICGSVRSSRSTRFWPHGSPGCHSRQRIAIELEREGTTT